MKTVIKFTILIFIVTLFILVTENCRAQSGSVGINGTGADPDPSAILDVNATDGGILIPRMFPVDRDAIPSPANGLLIYNKTSNKFNYYNNIAGKWYEIGAAFVSFTTGAVTTGEGIAVNVSSANHDPSAILDVSDPNRGILTPRTTTGGITSPATGLIIYNTSTNFFNYYNGSTWIALCAISTGASGATGSQSSKAIGINGTGAEPDQSAILDVSAINKGMLIPRLTTAQRSDMLPVTGLTIYNNTTNTIDYYNGSGWYMMEYNIPAIPGAITGSSSVCINQAGVTYSISAVSGAISYTWTVPSGATITAGQGTTSITVTFGSALGNVGVTAGNSCGNSGASNLAVTVNNPVATASSNSPICAGQNLNLTSSGGTTYNWSGPNSFTSTAQNPTITAATTAATGSYTVTATISGCTSTAQTAVTVNANPVATASNTGPYATGGTIQLNSSGGGTYNWGGPVSFTSTLQNPTRGSATTAMSGTYTVTVTLNGCTATASTTVTVNPPAPCGGVTTANYGPGMCATVEIGTQCWMTKNMDVGTMVAWSGLGTQTNTQKYCYNNDAAYCTAYGGLYQWQVALQGAGSCDGTSVAPPCSPTPRKGICPTGFHIPSNYEWYTMAHYLDNTYPDMTNGFQGTDCGTKLKPGGSSGFLALYGGYASSGSPYFWDEDFGGYFWTSYEVWPSSPDAYCYSVNDINTGVDREGSPWAKVTGLSVRCLKN